MPLRLVYIQDAGLYTFYVKFMQTIFMAECCIVVDTMNHLWYFLSLQVQGEIQEIVKTGLWVGDCFIYTSSVNRLNYYVGGEIVTIAHLDRYKMQPFLLENLKIS